MVSLRHNIAEIADKLLGRSYRVVPASELSQLEDLSQDQVLMDRLEEFKEAYPDKAHLVGSVSKADF